MQAIAIEQKLKATPLFSFLQVVFASLFIGLFAQIAIPLGFTPVPFSLQTLAVMLVGALLGSRKGTLAVALYLFEWAIGWPVFAGGHGGFAVFFCPSAGYLFSFLLEAFLIGYFLEKQRSFSFLKIAAAIFCASLLQLGIGTLWLSHFVGLKNAPLMGFYPFLLTDLVKVSMVTVYLSSRKRPHGQ